MKTIRYSLHFLIVLLGCVLTGCATKVGTLVSVPRENATSKHIVDRRYQYLSDKPSFTNTNPQSVDMLEKASSYFVYALMANNAYDHDPTNPKYPIRGWTLTNRFESTSGLALDVYEQIDRDGKPQLAVAFEGTNNGEKWKLDWSNNIGRGEPAQYKEAFAFMTELRRSRPDVQRIIAVGHSLGGGIALNMSVRLPNVDAVVFNSSFRAFSRARHYQSGNIRVHFTERGELMSFFSASWLRLRFYIKGYAGDEYTAYINNFMDYYFFAGSPLKEHSMYYLSRALLMMAISDGNSLAKDIFEAMDKQLVATPSTDH